MTTKRLVPIDLRVLDPAAIAPAALTISDRVHVEIAQHEPLILRLTNREGQVADLDAMASTFMDACWDHAMRIRLARESEPVRRLIVAQAFAHVDLLHPVAAATATVDIPASSRQPDRPHSR